MKKIMANGAAVVLALGSFASVAHANETRLEIATELQNIVGTYELISANNEVNKTCQKYLMTEISANGKLAISRSNTEADGHASVVNYTVTNLPVTFTDLPRPSASSFKQSDQNCMPYDSPGCKNGFVSEEYATVELNSATVTSSQLIDLKYVAKVYEKGFFSDSVVETKSNVGALKLVGPGQLQAWTYWYENGRLSASRNCLYKKKK